MKVPQWAKSVAAAAMILAVLGWGVWRIVDALEDQGYRWRWHRIPEFFQIEYIPGEVAAPPPGDTAATVTVEPALGGDEAQEGRWRLGLLVVGLITTVQLSFVSILTSLALGVVVGMARIVREPVLRFCARVYIELIRNTPLLVQIYVIYYLVGSAFDMGRFAAGVAALTIFSAAYVAEIVRGGIESIERGQTEAAQAIGLSWVQTMRHVILPQALRRMMAPLTGQFITLIKDSSLVSVIAITELTLAGKTIQGSHFISLEIWLTVAALYFCMTFPLSIISRVFEKRFEYHQ